MPSRVIDETGQASPKMSKGVWVLAGLVGLLVIAMVVVMMRFKDAPVSDPSQTPGPGFASTPAPSDEWISGVLRDDEHVAEVAPGLWRCSSSTTAAGTASVNGFEYGFEQTVQGAVASGAMFAQFIGSPDMIIQSKTDEFLQHVTVLDRGGLPVTADNFAQAAAQWGIDPVTGQPVDPDTGLVDDTMRFVAEAYPHYGMYKILWVDSAVGDLTPWNVWLTWVFPTINGIVPVGDDSAADVSVVWASAQMMLQWDPDQDGGAGDWVLASLRRDVTVPQLNVVNPGYQALATVAGGTGWCVPADSTQDPVPGIFGTR